MSVVKHWGQECQLRRVEVFSIHKLTREQFLSKKIEWEHTLAEGKEPYFKVMREVLEAQIEKKTIEEQYWYRHIYVHQMFTSIGKKLVLHEVVLPNFFFPEEKWRDEEDMVNPDDVGRKDLTYRDLVELRWGPGGNAYAVREKLNGIRFIMRQTAFGNVYCGAGLMVYLPKGIPTMQLEFSPHGVAMIGRYGFPDVMVGSVRFSGHRWRSPDEFKIKPNMEGIMILTSTGERRLRRYVTVEIDVDGEPYCSVVLQDRTVPLFPRYGKKVVKDLEQYRALPVLSVLEIPVTRYPVMNVETGAYFGPIVIGTDGIRIDSGYRLGVDQIVRHITAGEVVLPGVMKIGDVFNKVMLTQVSISPFGSDEMFSVSGAKCVVVGEDDAMLLFKDKDKPWDFIGGRIEPRETSVQALIREIKEETGCLVAAQNLLFLGISSEVSEGVNYYTYLYAARKEHFVGVPFLARIGKDEQPWVERLVSYVLRMYKSADHLELLLQLRQENIGVDYTAGELYNVLTERKETEYKTKMGHVYHLQHYLRLSRGRGAQVTAFHNAIKRVMYSLQEVDGHVTLKFPFLMGKTYSFHYERGVPKVAVRLATLIVKYMTVEGAFKDLAEVDFPVRVLMEEAVYDVRIG